VTTEPLPFTLSRATEDDLEALWRLESLCFPESRRDSRRSLRHSLRSSGQEVWLLRNGNKLAGAMICRTAGSGLRIHSLAVDPAFRGQGGGHLLLDRVKREARQRRLPWISLEADAARKDLCAWYAEQGWTPLKTVPDYYGPGEHALRMRWINPGEY